jgi:acyl-CoA synthetase (AMP-forming)/AMP-acid ligase II
VTLLNVFLRRANQHPDRTAIVEADGASTTYAELVRRAGQLASTFAAQGIGPGDRVLVAVWPSIRLYAALAAIWQCGAVAVLAEASMGLAGLRQAAAAAKPKAMLADLPVRLLSWLLPQMHYIPLGRSPRPRHDARPAAFHRATAGEAALISFTSGTTGRPKGMVRSHGRLLAQHEALAPLIAPRREREVDLVAFPAFVLTCLGHGNTVVMPNWNLRRHDLVSAAEISRRAQASGATRLLVPPVITARLAQEGLVGSVDRVLTGGGPIYPDVARTFLARNLGIGLTIVYGSTEAEPISHVDAESLSDDDWRDAAHGAGLLVGRPVAQATVRIDAGEILVAGPHVNESYLDPTIDTGTKLRFGGRVFHRTGDAGRFDSSGRLWLLGRLTALREDIHPFAIETAARMQPGVKGAALVPLEERTLLFIEGPLAGLDRDFQARLETLRVEVRTIPAIPLDRRHRSKPDYAALSDIAARRA